MLNNLQIFLLYFRCLSWVRLSNMLFLYVSFWLSRIIRKPLIWAEPFALSLEPTSICNLKCPQCPTGTNSLQRARGTMSMDTFRAILQNLGASTWYLNLYLQGEPTIHPQFAEMVKLAKAQKMFVITSTNGHFIAEQMAKDIVASRLDKIIISYDGATQDVFEKYRVGGSIELVERAINLLSTEKINQKSRVPIIEVQYILFKHNEHQVEKAKVQAFNLGADIFAVKSAQFYLADEALQNQTTVTKYQRYKLLAPNTLLARHKQYNHCWISWSSSVISWQGIVFPCCFDKDGEYNFGWANNTPLKQIETSQTASQFKQRILTNRHSMAICANCTGGSSFWG